MQHKIEDFSNDNDLAFLEEILKKVANLKKNAEEKIKVMPEELEDFAFDETAMLNKFKLSRSIKEEIKKTFQDLKNCKDRIEASFNFDIDKTSLLGRLNEAETELNTILAQHMQEEISSGVYYFYLKRFTELDNLTENSFFIQEIRLDCVYRIYMLFNEPDFRCSLAIPSVPQVDPVEIHLNFYGTIDLTSHVNNFDIGGPGEEVIKKYQAQLIQKLNNIIKQISPEKTIWLRIAGFSQGGAIAKQCTHILQKACALQKNTPQEITQKIQENFNYSLPQKKLSLLERTLEEENNQYKGLTELTKIQGITLYTHGAPGVSRDVDSMATLMTYYHEPHFLWISHSFHKEDIIVKFGESEFLSGKNEIPRTVINKAIIFDIEIPKDRSSELLPLSDILSIPFVTPRHMAAHRADIFFTDSSTFIIKEVSSCNELEKLEFPFIQHRAYRLFFSTLGFFLSIGKIQELFSDRIELRSFFQFNQLNQEIVKKIYSYMDQTSQESLKSVNKKYYGLFKSLGAELLSIISRSDGNDQNRIKAILQKNPKLILTKYRTGYIKLSAFQMTVLNLDVKNTILLLRCLPCDQIGKFILDELAKEFSLKKTQSYNLESFDKYIEACKTEAVDEQKGYWDVVKSDFNRIPISARQTWNLKTNFSAAEPPSIYDIRDDYQLIKESLKTIREFYESLNKILPLTSIDLLPLKLDELETNYSMSCTSKPKF